MTPEAMLAVGLILAVFSALLAAMTLARRRGVHPEITRKAIHVGMGAITLSFPWLFDSAWPVAAIGLGTVAVLAALRRSPGLRRTVGSAISDVERVSHGEFFFPVAVVLTFVLAHGNPVNYSISILILGFADPAAAAAGLQYGRLRYTTGADRKSTEGSAMFFLVAFLATHLVLLLGTDTGRLESVLIGLTLGMLAMMLEAVSRWGADNLLVPVGAVLLLGNLRGQPEDRLWVALAVITGLLGIVLAWRRKATLNDAALLGAALCGYVAWAVGGWTWVPAPLILFIAYPFLAPATYLSQRRVHDLFAVMAVALPGAAWLAVAAWMKRPELLFPYTLSCAAHLAMVVLVRMRHGHAGRTPTRSLALCIVESWLLLFIPYLALVGWTSQSMLEFAVAPLALTVGVAIFSRWQGHLENYPAGRDRWVREVVAATLTSLLGLVPLMIGW